MTKSRSDRVSGPSARFVIIKDMPRCIALNDCSTTPGSNLMRPRMVLSVDRSVEDVSSASLAASQFLCSALSFVGQA